MLFCDVLCMNYTSLLNLYKMFTTLNILTLFSFGWFRWLAGENARHLFLLSITGEKKARVAHPRKDTCSREVLRHDDLRDLVKLTRVKSHFICEYT